MVRATVIDILFTKGSAIVAITLMMINKPLAA